MRGKHRRRAELRDERRTQEQQTQALSQQQELAARMQRCVQERTALMQELESLRSRLGEIEAVGPPPDLFTRLQEERDANRELADTLDRAHRLLRRHASGFIDDLTRAVSGAAHTSRMRDTKWIPAQTARTAAKVLGVSYNDNSPRLRATRMRQHDAGQ